MTDRPNTGPGRGSVNERSIPGPRAVAAVAFVLASGLSCGPLGAQSNAPDPQARKGEAVRQLESTKDNLRQTEQRMKSLQSDVQNLNAEQSRVTEQLIATGKLAQDSEARLGRIEARVAQLDTEERQIRSSLAARHNKIAKLFSAMQRMGRNPPPVIVTRREDALQMVRSAMLLARAFPELKTQADELAARLQEFVRVTTEARAEGERLKLESARLTEARTQLAALVENKKESLSDRQRELADVRRMAAEISRNVNELGDLVGRLDKLEKAVAERTGLAAYDRELKQREAREARAANDKEVAVATPAPPSPQLRPTEAVPVPKPPLRETTKEPVPVSPVPGPPVTVPPVTGPPASSAGSVRVVMAPTTEQLASLTANPGRMKPAIPFPQTRGRLPMPVAGRQVLGFKEKNQFGRLSPGVVIETRHGATVTSPADGWIVYAGEFRSYGQVLIINAGGGYHVLLANLARVDVEVGRFVLMAEPVGAMSSNVVGNSKQKLPILYVEFRNKDGQSFDPTPWWAEGSKKVQG